MRLVATIMSGLLVIAPLAACDEKDQAGDDAKQKQSQSESSSKDGNGKDEKDEAKGDDSSKDGDGAEAEVTSLTGTIVDGVEAKCVLFEADGEKYELIGDKTKNLKAGTEVTVTGKVSKDTMSTCMAGKKLEVDSVKSK